MEGWRDGGMEGCRDGGMGGASYQAFSFLKAATSVSHGVVLQLAARAELSLESLESSRKKKKTQAPGGGDDSRLQLLC